MDTTIIGVFIGVALTLGIIWFVIDLLRKKIELKK